MSNTTDFCKELIEEIRTAIANKEDYEINVIGTPALLQEALEDTNCVLGYDFDITDWEGIYSASLFENDDKIGRVYGNMYYGRLEIEFDNE